jgi:hypothetical protein
MNLLLTQLLVDADSADRARAADPGRTRSVVMGVARRMARRGALASAVAVERIHPSWLARLDRCVPEPVPPAHARPRVTL